MRDAWTVATGLVLFALSGAERFAVGVAITALVLAVAIGLFMVDQLIEVKKDTRSTRELASGLRDRVDELDLRMKQG